MPTASHDAGPDAVAAASKVLAVLRELGRRSDASIGVTEAARAVGLPKSTAHRLLRTLEQQEFVERHAGRYRAGRALFEVTETLRWSGVPGLHEASTQPLTWLFERADAVAVHLAVLSGPDVLYLDKVSRPAGIHLPSRVGGRFPATCTALGKAMLSRSPRDVVGPFLEQRMARATPYSVVQHTRLVEQLRGARSTGYATEFEESCQGSMCVAAPVVHDGRPVAAVSLSLPTVGSGRSAVHRLSPYGDLAVEAARRIADSLPV